METLAVFQLSFHAVHFLLNSCIKRLCALKWTCGSRAWCSPPKDLQGNDSIATEFHGKGGGTTSQDANIYIYEIWHDKTNKMSVRPAKTLISMGIRPVWSESQSLSAWRKPWVPTERTAKTLIRLGGCPGWSESSLGAHSFLLVLSFVAHMVYTHGYTRGSGWGMWNSLISKI